MAVNFPNPEIDMNTHVHHAHRAPHRFNQREFHQKTLQYNCQKSENFENSNNNKKLKITTYSGIPIGYEQISQWKVCRPRESGIIYSKC